MHWIGPLCCLVFCTSYHLILTSTQWLVNNFYPLSFYSEKGILASPLPFDAYMSDLNAGQCWYRPSYMLV